MTDTELLTAYRHAKALASSLERLLRSNGTIKCPQCGIAHPMGEPHMARPRGTIGIMLNRVEVSGTGKV